MILQLQQELKAEGVTVSMVKLCQWFKMPRLTVYYRPNKGAPKVQEKFVTPIKAMIEKNPSFGYRTVAHVLGMNKNTVQRVFQCMGWQVRKRPVGFRPRIQALPSRALAPNERWATDLCRVWTGRDGWAVNFSEIANLICMMIMRAVPSSPTPQPCFLKSTRC